MKGLDQRYLGRWGVQYLAAIDRNHYLSTVDMSGCSPWVPLSLMAPTFGCKALWACI